MSLLEELGAKSAPSRLLYDDEFDGPEAQQTDASCLDTFPRVDPTTRFPWTAAAPAATTVPAITTLIVAVDSLAATWTRAFVEHANAGKRAPEFGELRLTYPQPYVANRSSEPISCSLPVILATTAGVACVSLNTLATFPAELHTALITSLLSATKPKRILTLTSGSLNVLPHTVRCDTDDDRARVLALRNNFVPITSPAKGVAPPMPAPMTLTDLSAAALVQSTLASLPASTVVLYLPHVRGAPEVTLAAMKEWSAAIQAELGAEVKMNVDVVAKKAEALGAEQAAKFHPMYL